MQYSTVTKLVTTSTMYCGACDSCALRRDCVEVLKGTLYGREDDPRQECWSRQGERKGVWRVRDMLGLLPDDEKEEADGGTAEEGRKRPSSPTSLLARSRVP